MRPITIMKIVAVSAALLSGTAAFAARAPDHGMADICREQAGQFCRTAPFAVEMPRAGIMAQARSAGDGQARANARSKTWPGDMILD